MNFINKEQLNNLRDEYLKGDIVELIRMDDPYSTLVKGDRGVVNHIDDMGTVHINWDNGSTLGAVYGVDIIKKV